MLIDVEQIPRRRIESPQISFRRNDNDRRPARPVMRPNDYAPDMDARLAYSAKVRAQIEAKRVVVENPEKDRRREARAALTTSHNDRVKTEGYMAMLSVVKLVRDGCKTTGAVSKRKNCNKETARRYLGIGFRKGYLVREVARDLKVDPKCSFFLYSVTKEGLKALEGVV